VKEGELHHLLVRFSCADAAVMGPDRSPGGRGLRPLPFLFNLGVGIMDELTDMSERLPAPIGKFLDLLVNECRGRFCLDGLFHVSSNFHSHFSCAQSDLHARSYSLGWPTFWPDCWRSGAFGRNLPASQSKAPASQNSFLHYFATFALHHSPKSVTQKKTGRARVHARATLWSLLQGGPMDFLIWRKWASRSAMRSASLAALNTVFASYHAADTQSTARCALIPWQRRPRSPNRPFT
jgi:hypothetical protein